MVTKVVTFSSTPALSAMSPAKSPPAPSTAEMELFPSYVFPSEEPNTTFLIVPVLRSTRPDLASVDSTLKLYTLCPLPSRVAANEGIGLILAPPQSISAPREYSSSAVRVGASLMKFNSCSAVLMTVGSSGVGGVGGSSGPGSSALPA